LSRAIPDRSAGSTPTRDQASSDIKSTHMVLRPHLSSSVARGGRGGRGPRAAL